MTISALSAVVVVAGHNSCMILLEDAKDVVEIRD